MLPDKPAVCRVVELSMPTLPRRSRLYSLPPIGVGTPYVESLTGYVARLAEAHCVSAGTLLTKEVVGRFARATDLLDEKPKEKKPANHLECINGVTATAANWVRILGALTHRHDLHGLTMLAWTGVLPWRGLLRNHRAWCPQCLGAGVPVAEPLLWSINAVALCPKHERLLVSSCPHCHQTLPALGWQTRPGYCSKCRRWLGCDVAQRRKRIAKTDLVQQLWTANAVGDMLAVSSLKPPPAGSLIQALRSRLGRGASARIASIARHLDENKVTVRAWLAGTRQPQLNRLLGICQILNTTPLHLLTSTESSEQTITKMTGRASTRKRVQRKRHRKIDVRVLRRELEAVLLDSAHEPLSMSQTSRRIGFGREILYKHYPELCRTISAKYLAFRADRSRQRRTLLKDEVQAIVSQLRGAGIEPTSKEVARRLTKPGAIRDQVAREILNDVYQSNISRGVSHGLGVGHLVMV